MFPAPRLVLIDDNIEHLQALVTTLHALGTATYPIHFTGELEGLLSCAHARIIFADLHLNDSADGGDEKHFSLIGGLISETIKPTGPYVLVLWTQYADKAAALAKFLDERMDAKLKPIGVKSLDKAIHLQKDKIKDSAALRAAVLALFDDWKEIRALLDWEERALGAAADTVSSILRVASTAGGGVKLNDLLYQLAEAAVGSGNVDADRFGAVNEALLPILADRIGNIRSADANNLWEAAFGTAAHKSMALQQVAEVNTLSHIADCERDATANRGAVIELPKYLAGGQFEVTFGTDQTTVAHREFGAPGFTTANANYVWRLVQVQAPCDYAQKQLGPAPYVLALEMDHDAIPKGSVKDAVWRSPEFVRGDKIRVLTANVRFSCSVSAAASKKYSTAVYRLRDPLLGQLSHTVHSYLSRPGIIRLFPPKK